MRNDRTERKRIRESFGAACGMPMRAVAAGRAAKQGAGARPRQVLQILCVLLLALGLLSGCGGSGTQAQVKCVDIVKACSKAADDGTLDEWYSYGEDAYEDSFDTPLRRAV